MNERITVLAHITCVNSASVSKPSDSCAIEKHAYIPQNINKNDLIQVITRL